MIDLKARRSDTVVARESEPFETNRSEAAGGLELEHAPFPFASQKESRARHFQLTPERGEDPLPERGPPRRPGEVPGERQQAFEARRVGVEQCLGLVEASLGVCGTHRGTDQVHERVAQ